MTPLWDNDITVDLRPYVMEVQSYLRVIQRERYGTVTVPQDGFFGSDTTAGVRQFQLAEGLTPDGVVDRVTWAALYRVYEDIRRQQAPPQTIVGLRQPQLRLGDTGDAVVFLNQMLGIEATAYSPATEEAVRQWQAVSGLPVTGRTDRDTWNAITAHYNQGGAV